MSKHLIYCLCAVTSVLLFACQDDRSDDRVGDKCDCATGANCSPEELAACPAPTVCDCATGTNCSPEELAGCSSPSCDCQTGENCSADELEACPKPVAGCTQPCENGQVCDELTGSCVDPSCSVDKPTCDGQILKYCIDGIEYQEDCGSDTCDAEHAQCVKNPCGGACSDQQFCDPYTNSCLPFECLDSDEPTCLENDVSQSCEFNQFVKRDCKQIGAVCDNGRCVACHDTSGKQSCENNKLIECKEGVIIETPCEFGCDVAKAQCNECEVGSYRCTPRGEREVCKGLSWEKKRCTSGWCDSEITPKTGECVSCTPDLNPDACDGVDSVIHCVWGDEGWENFYGITRSISCKDGLACPAGETKCVPKKLDYCPDDPNKTEPGICGCGKSDTGNNIADSDGDGVKNCVDECPDNPYVAHLSDDGCSCDQIVVKNAKFRDGSKCAYPIDGAREFAKFRDDWNAGKYKNVPHKNFILMSDINFDDISNNSSRLVWEPVKNFTGDFDAHSMTIEFLKNGNSIDQRFVSSGLFSQANGAKFMNIRQLVLYFEANKPIAGGLVDSAKNCIFDNILSRVHYYKTDDVSDVTFGGVTGQDINGQYHDIRYTIGEFAIRVECQGICGGIVGNAVNTSLSNIQSRVFWYNCNDLPAGAAIGQYTTDESVAGAGELRNISVYNEVNTGRCKRIWGGAIGKMRGKQLKNGGKYQNVLIDDIFVAHSDDTGAVYGGLIGELDLTHMSAVNMSRVNLTKGHATGRLIGQVLRGSEDDAVNSKTSLTVEQIKDVSSNDYKYLSGLIEKVSIEPGGAKELNLDFSRIYINSENMQSGSLPVLFGGLIGENSLKADVNHHVKMNIDRVSVHATTDLKHRNISYYGGLIGHNYMSNASTYYDHLILNITNVNAYNRVVDYSDEIIKFDAIGGLIGFDEMHGPMQRLTGNVSSYLALLNGRSAMFPLSEKFGAIWGVLSLNNTASDNYRYYNLFGHGEFTRIGKVGYVYHMSPVGLMDKSIKGDAFNFYFDDSYYKEHGAFLNYCSVDDLATNLWCTDTKDLAILKDIANNMIISPFWGEDYESGKKTYIYRKHDGTFDSMVNHLNQNIKSYQQYAPNGNVNWVTREIGFFDGKYQFPYLNNEFVDNIVVPEEWGAPALKPNV